MTGQGTTTRGRPRGTTKRELELIAMRLFSAHGFDNTTVEQIAAAAGISGRTFFRYFPTKAEVLWSQFDDEIAALEDAFATIADTVPMMTAVRRVVVDVNTYRAEDIPELRTRMHLIANVPALAATAGAHYDAWERAVSSFAARRLDAAEDDLIPLAVGRTTLAAARAAFDAWLNRSTPPAPQAGDHRPRADADLTVYLEQALSALERGFSELPSGFGDRAAGV
ncbi:mycofactocin system transcriptional regulator [Nocardia goodfellowii]